MRKMLLSVFALVAFVGIATCEEAQAVANIQVKGVSEIVTTQPTVTQTTATVGAVTFTAYDVHPVQSSGSFSFASGYGGINIPQTGGATQTATFAFNPFPAGGGQRIDYFMTGLANEANPILYPSLPAANANKNMCAVAQDAVTGKFYGLTGNSFDTTTLSGVHHVCRFRITTATGASPNPIKTNGLKRIAYEFFTNPTSTLNPNGANSWSDIFIFNPQVNNDQSNWHDSALVQSGITGIFTMNTLIDALLNFAPNGQ